jgi:hypothetical protein
MKKGLGLRAVALVALALAVAVGALVASPGAEAAVRDTAEGATLTEVPITKHNGDTVYIHSDHSNYVEFTITTVGKAEATFTHSSASNNGRTINCRQNIACDVDQRIADGDGTTVALKIADDAGEGAVFVTRKRLDGTDETNPVDEIGVAVAQVPTRLTVTPSPKAVEADDVANDDTSTVAIRLTDANGKGIGGRSLTVIATLGEFSDTPPEAAVFPNSWPAGVTLGSMTGSGPVRAMPTSQDNIGTDSADEAGYAALTFTAGSVSGIARIEVRVADSALTASTNIVLFGPATTITASAEQSSIEQGGKTFIVVTATDAAGNPVANYNRDVKTNGVAGPEAPAGTSATLVRESNTVDKDVAPIGGTAAGTGDLPACGDAPDRTDDTTTTTVDESTWWTGNGTNSDGQCVIEVDAGPAEGTEVDATRGTHTITIEGPKGDGSDDVEVAIQVGGPPNSITSDAPARIDPLQEITVNLTVHDDTDVRVGEVDIEVLQISRDGLLTEVPTKTEDGRASFKFLAGSQAGTAQLLVRTRTAPADAADSTVTAQLAILIDVGMPVVEEPEPEPMISLDLRAGGFLYAVTAEGPATTASALFGDAINSAWKYNQDTGVWDVVYIPGRSGNFSINTGDILYVSSPIDQTVGG